KRRATGTLLPQVGLQLNGGIRKFGLYTMDGAGNIATEILPGQIVPIHLPDMIVGLQASWEIDIWGKLRNQRKSAVAQYMSTIEGTNLVISNLVADIANSYYSLVALDKELEIIRAFIIKQEEALEVIKAQKESGNANELGVLQFRAQLLESKALEFDVLQKIVETENLINFLLGRYPQPITRSSDALDVEFSVNLETGVPSQLLEYRPDIRRAEYEVQATRFDLKAAKAAFFPNITINAGAGFQAFNPTLLFNPASLAYSVIGNLFAPLINMSALKAQFHMAKANQLTAMYNYQKTILNGYVEVVNELNRMQNLKNIEQLKTEQNEVLDASVLTAEELFKRGKAEYLEILFTQKNSLQTQLDLVNVKKQHKQAQINLYKALGGGWK
ncbi:MAG TPA: TolC family protein, partial [Bacteroidia bacterium]